MAYQHIKIPDRGAAISVNAKNDHDYALSVPEQPIIPYIEGDGIGSDITPVTREVIDAAVALAYAGQRELVWMEIFNGEKAATIYDGNYFPDETLAAIKEFKVALKGPLTTPVGGGFRSLNVALRQVLDLYVCQRPVRWLKGVPSPVLAPEKVDMVIFRENAEDIYAGIEWQADSAEAKQLIKFLMEDMGVTKIRFPDYCGIGVKPVSRSGTKRLVRRSIQYALRHHRNSVTLVHKGNIMKYTEGAFRDWGYELAREEFGARPIDGGPWHAIPRPEGGEDLLIKDAIADAMLQQLLLRPSEYDVITTLNLNGDYLSDALAAQVGGIGIAPGANLGDGIALFEATHGTAPKYAGQDKVNPCSLILSAEMMLRHLGWDEAADLTVRGIERAIGAKTVTYDFARLMSSAQQVSCSEFGGQVIAQMRS